MTQQHYRVTLEQAISHYNAGDLTAKGLVHFYLKIKLKQGWRIKIHHKEVCTELGIGKSAFYNAISRLKAEGSIDWEAPDGILVSISESFRECGIDSAIVESQSAIAESQSAIAESQSAIVESQSAIVESQSAIVEPNSPKTLSDKGLADSPHSLTNFYQIFINSLSEGEREKFFYFVKQQIRSLREPIVDLEAWLASKNAAGQNRWEVYYDLFQDSEKRARGEKTEKERQRPLSFSERNETRRQAMLRGEKWIDPWGIESDV